MHIDLDVKIDFYKRNNRVKVLIILFIFFLLAITAILSISIGAIKISFFDVIKTLLFKTESKKLETIIWNIRLPQVITAILAGASLSIAGLIMQTTLNNPLASPFTLGISHAASFGASFSVIFLRSGVVQSKGNISITNYYEVTFFAFFFCLLTSFVVLIIAKIKKSSPYIIVLTGVALGSLFSAATMFLQYFSTDAQLASVVFWTFGDTSRGTWQGINLLGITFLFSIFYFYINSIKYNAILSQDESAKSVGVNVEMLRITSMLLASLVSSVTVALLGIIAFIGLISPHIAKILIGDDHRFLIPLTPIIGAFILLLSDTLARNLFLPYVLPVSILTSFLGAPLFIYLLIRGKKL